jgi:hypothetical protein
MRYNAVYIGRQIPVNRTNVLSSMFSTEVQFFFCSESKAVALYLGVDGFGVRSGDNLASQWFLVATLIFSRQMPRQYLKLNQHLPFQRPTNLISLFSSNTSKPGQL